MSGMGEGLHLKKKEKKWVRIVKYTFEIRIISNELAI